MPDILLDTSTGLTNSDLANTTALISDVLSGKTFYSGDDTLKSGTMTNRGTWNSTINPGASVTIPAGYHNGSGVVRANPVTYAVAQIANVNTRATSYSVSGSGHAYYVFVSTTYHGCTTGFSVSGGTQVLYSFMTTTDFDDGLGRQFGHFCIIKANSPSGTVTVNATVGNNHYGAARCIFVGL